VQQVDWLKCSQKWTNLVRDYHNFITHCRSTSAGRRDPPWFGFILRWTRCSMNVIQSSQSVLLIHFLVITSLHVAFPLSVFGRKCITLGWVTEMNWTWVWLVYSHSWCLVWSCTGAIVIIMWFVVTFGFVIENSNEAAIQECCDYCYYSWPWSPQQTYARFLNRGVTQG